MNATALAAEAARYLEAIDFFRSMELDVEWRCEADELGLLGPRPRMQRVSREIAGTAALYRDTRLSEILRRSADADSAVYTTVEAE